MISQFSIHFILGLGLSLLGRRKNMMEYNSKIHFKTNTNESLLARKENIGAKF